MQKGFDTIRSGSQREDSHNLRCGKYKIVQQPFEALVSKYGLTTGEYYYCVSSMLPHKNLETVLRVMELRRHRGENISLVLSGVGGRNADFEEKVTALKIDARVINTGFVSDAERDCLYENCRLF